MEQEALSWEPQYDEPHWPLAEPPIPTISASDAEIVSGRHLDAQIPPLGPKTFGDHRYYRPEVLGVLPKRHRPSANQRSAGAEPLAEPHFDRRRERPSMTAGRPKLQTTASRNRSKDPRA